MILDLHRQGLSVTAIARRTGRDPKTIRKYIERGLDPAGLHPFHAAGVLQLPRRSWLRERLGRRYLTGNSSSLEGSLFGGFREVREAGQRGVPTALRGTERQRDLESVEARNTPAQHALVERQERRAARGSPVRRARFRQ